MSAKIKTINIKAFRGIPDLELNLDGRSIVIHGENGTGKSSIVESFEFFFTGKVAHLEGVRGLSLEKHGTHVNYVPDDVIVKTTFDPGNVTLSRTFKLRPNPTKLLEKYFNISQNGTFILRRSQILEFIICQPGERFRAIGNLIGIERLDSIELEMMRVYDDLVGKINSKYKEIYNKNREINNLVSAFSKVIEKDIIEEKDVLPVLNKILQEAELPLLKSIDDVGKHAEEMLKRVRKTASTDKTRVINEIKEEIESATITEDMIVSLDNLGDKIVQLLDKQIILELSIADLLSRGRDVISDEELDACPLCEQKIDRETLLRRIDKRIQTVRDLSDKASIVRRLSVLIIEGIKEKSKKLETVISKMGVFPEFGKERKDLYEKVGFLNSFVDEIVLAKDLKKEIKPKEFVKKKEEINGIIKIVSEKCIKLFSEIDLTEDEKKVLKISRLIEQATTKTAEIAKINNEIKVYHRYHKIAEKVYYAFSDTKKKKIQEVYDFIQGDIRNFYTKLHPNEPHKNIEITVALGRRASTELKIESFGREGEDPRALTSEGHLDSLGLCIFLAFVKKFNIGCPLIVLDDVVTTIDARHRENICKLLFEEFIDNQLIITTHDGVWYEQLCANQRAFGIEGDFKNFKILNWDKDSGPKIRPYKTRWETIKGKIDNGDKTGAGNDGRQYLEWLLEEIVYNILVPVVPKRVGGFNVVDLLNPTKRRLSELLTEGEFEDRVSNSFQILESTGIMGNLLSHNNILAANVSLDEVRRFCDSVHNLHRNFLCPECRNFLTYIQKLKILRCSGRNCKNPFEIKLK